MRVVVVGAQGTGKTTLVNGLNLPILPEVARLAASHGFKLDGNASLSTELWIAAKQYELEESKRDWIADRSFIDLLAYILVLFPDDTELFNIVLRMAKPQIEKYDLILYLPSGQFPIEDDGLRTTSVEFQEQVDSQIKVILSSLDLKYQPILGTPDERIRKVQKLIINQKEAV